MSRSVTQRGQSVPENPGSMTQHYIEHPSSCCAAREPELREASIQLASFALPLLSILQYGNFSDMAVQLAPPGVKYCELERQNLGLRHRQLP